MTRGKASRRRRAYPTGPRTPGVTTSVHQLDDGAWVSVNDERVVGVSDLWRLDSDFCDCRLTDFLAEGFVEVGVGSPGRGGGPHAVEARVAGQCIACDVQGVTGWLALGRVDYDHGDGAGARTGASTGLFRAVDTGSVRRPRAAGRGAAPRRVE